MAKTCLQCCFTRGGGMSHLTKYQEGKFSYEVASPKEAPHTKKKKQKGPTW